ncbi:hypothetical protein C4K39_0597 [Pseudomonas sessilinigenes]|nr:hypothetical protein C4K39_0597 [Pseudomonas sessilinigenes]
MVFSLLGAGRHFNKKTFRSMPGPAPGSNRTVHLPTIRASDTQKSRRTCTKNAQ